MSENKLTTGFSLVEVMVSAVLVLIVMIGVTGALTTQQRTHAVIDQVSEAQQNLRAVAELVERDLRRSGFMVPQHAAVCAHDATTEGDTLFVSKSEAIRTVFDLEAENLSLNSDKGAPVVGNSTLNASGGSYSLTLQRRWVDYAPDGDDFAVNEGVIVVSERNAGNPVACGKITGIAGNTLTVNFGSTSTGAVGSNANVLAIPAHIYELQVGTGGVPNKLRRDNRLLATDVEDFQLTFFFDNDDDLVVDAGEQFATSGGTARPWELLPLANRPNFSTLREVGVNIVTVTRRDDPNVDYQMGAGQVTGNRTSASLPTGDGKRRRVSTTRVRLRNI